MSIFTEVVNDLKGLYPDLALDPSEKSARKSVTITENLILYEERDFEEWEVVDNNSGNITIVKDVRGATRLIVMEFVSVFKEFKQEAEQKEATNNVKPDGCETSSEQAVIVDDIEEKKRILDALENGEIKRPEPKSTSGRIRTERAEVGYNEENSTAYNGSVNIEPVNLPAPAGIGGIVRPAVSAAEALAAWREFQELKHAILSKSDVKKIQGKDFVVKSGWRKFATFYNLTDVIVDEQRQDLGNSEFLWKMKVVCTAPNGRQTEGVAICTSTEKKFAHPEHDVYTTCHTRAKNRAISDMIAAGEVSAEEMEA